ncbi:NAD(P)/FAD-dependent oxidoreductase [Aquimarina pacifica]|uniref:NAD(P)/FAD-dependent oxidoreductase n=1 Tax=Aquimarina pacifica TaxID=1296415 RepID=UPI0004726EE6|nr:NAD(P)/FAD-dependent oxidoreductase [Aquimarina pacifica]
MKTHSHILIIGGGLAGLTSAIHLGRAGIKVTLLEKDTYPKHKVCGEYISNEVLPYLKTLDINPSKKGAVSISELLITTQKGHHIQSELPLGGFGISRYTLDHFLWEKALAVGVEVINTQVIDIQYKNEYFLVKTSDNLTIRGTYVIGAYGKRSIIEKALNPKKISKKHPWLAVKAHYTTNFNENRVALHNFKGGYCGLSMVENQKVNACYMVSYQSFKKYKSIADFQKEVMYRNPYLEAFFKEAQPEFDKPLTISQINFDKKNSVENHIFMTGDAAGLIHPLCGNGMAMAIQSAQILCELLIKDYKNPALFSREEIEKQYCKQWSETFSKRLYAGRVLQRILLNPTLQEVSYTVANVVPAVVPRIIKQTHGNPLVC